MQDKGLRSREVENDTVIFDGIVSGEEEHPP